MAALISINNKLQQPEAARGVLDYAIKNHRLACENSDDRRTMCSGLIGVIADTRPR